MTDGNGAGRYAIDTVVSRFTVRAFAGGMLSALGHSPTFAVRSYSGQIQFDPTKPEAASLELKVQAASLSLTDNVSQSDRRTIERTMQEDVLESEKYQEITFVSDKAAISSSTVTGPLDISLTGRLTLHGVTETVVIPARVALMGNSLRAFGEFGISQSAFGIKAVSVGGSMIKVKDELKCVFDIVAK